MPVEEQVVSIYSGVRGYLDKIAVGDVTRFESMLLSEVRAKHADILEEIRTKRELTKEVDENLKEVLEKFSKSFA